MRGPGDTIDANGYRDRMARIFTPTTPYLLAVRSLVVPAKQSNRSTMRGSSNPAVPNASMISASSRAPAIQPVQRSMSRSALSGSVSPMRMSAIWARPPGLRTRAISDIALRLSGTRFSTPFDITTSTL